MNRIEPTFGVLPVKISDISGVFLDYSLNHLKNFLRSLCFSRQNLMSSILISSKLLRFPLSDSLKGEAQFSDMLARYGDGLVAFWAFFVFSNLISVNCVS